MLPVGIATAVLTFSKRKANPMKTTIKLNQREKDTILAALRLWQRTGDTDKIPELEIAENDRRGRNARLSNDEIDVLCEERINV